MDFHLNKKSQIKNVKVLGCCIDGKVIKIDQVNDDIFSTKILGDGYAVIPEGKNVKCYFDALVKDISRSGNCVTLHTDDGLHVLVNFGLNLSKSSKKYVSIKVSLGERVKPGDIIATIDAPTIVKDGYDPSVCIVITNSDDLKYLNVKTSEYAQSGSSVLEYVL